MLDESERDNRLLSKSTVDMSSNGYPTMSEAEEDKTINDSSKKTPVSVSCDLKRARWETVEYI